MFFLPLAKSDNIDYPYPISIPTCNYGNGPPINSSWAILWLIGIYLKMTGWLPIKWTSGKDQSSLASSYSVVIVHIDADDNANDACTRNCLVRTLAQISCHWTEVFRWRRGHSTRGAWSNACTRNCLVRTLWTIECCGWRECNVI
jgi:hypothetical protein